MIEMYACAFLIGCATGAGFAIGVALDPLRQRCRLMTDRWLRAKERHDLAKLVLARMIDEEAKDRRASAVA